MKDYFVVGDVHGCFYTLEALLKNWKPDEQQLIFVGDIIDHGNHSPQVASLINTIQKENPDTIILRGNHEQLLINHCLNEFNVDWYQKSGDKTYCQYLAAGKDISEDAKWFATFPVYFNDKTIFVSHAGMPKVENPFDANNIDGIVWHRNELQNLQQIRVYGHTPKDKALFDITFNAIN